MNNNAIKVLLIDDDEEDYILTRDLFSMVSEGNYILDWASSYEEGLRVVEDRQHDVCLVDFNLGARSGVDLIREAREARLTTPMILLTGGGSQELDMAAMYAGATDYLLKDETSPTRLERTVRYAVQLNLERRRAEAELAVYAQRHSAVAEIGRIALAGGELADLFAEVVRIVTHTLGVGHCEVRELLPEAEGLILRAGAGWNEDDPTGAPTEADSQAAYTLVSNGPVLVEDLRKELRFKGQVRHLEHGIVSGLSVVIRGANAPYGVLGAHSTALRKFSNDEVNFLSAVANVLGEAIARKHAEDELRASEARFRRVVETNVLGIFFSDEGGKISSANDAFLEMVGYDREDLSAGELNWTTMSPPEYTVVDKRAIVQISTLGVCETYEKEFIRKDSSRVPVLISVTTFGESGGSVAFVLDNSDRKRTEEFVRQSESKFRALFENALDSVMIANDEGVYVDLNPAACLLLGASYEDIVGHSVGDFNTNKEPRHLAQQWEQFRRDGSMRGLASLRRADGEIREVDFTVTANFIPGRHLSILRDVTDHRKLEVQLNQSQKLESVGLLAGGIAHDFNNLLTIITGYSELGLKSRNDGKVVARHFDEIKKAAGRAATLTRQLLAFSRRQVLQPRILDLNSILEGISKMISRLVGEDMELQIVPGADLRRVRADPGQLEQVIVNLCINARDSMPNGGEIKIETGNIFVDDEFARGHPSMGPGWHVLLRISDTGIGMDEETSKHIFEPFFTTKELGKGTGLGLATVYGIIKQSGGSIWVSSKVNAGTSVEVYLPAVDAQLSQPDEVVPSAVMAGGTETILLAEDDELVRHVTRESLQSYGYSVLEAGDGYEALLISRAHSGPIHLLLADVVMPRMSGKELADELVVLRPETRVLYMSGYTDQAIVHHGILDGDTSLIEKPFTPESLALKVAGLLHHAGELPTSNGEPGAA